MSWLKKALGIKTVEEVAKEVEKEPTIKNARKALRRADDILEEYERAEALRFGVPKS